MNVQNEQRAPESTNKHRAGGPRQRLLETCARLATRRPRATLALAALLAVAGALLAWSQLELDADTNSLIAAEQPFMIDYVAFMEEFGDLEAIYVIVDAGSPPAPERAQPLVDELIGTLGATFGPDRVRGRITPTEQWRVAPRAMSLEALGELVEARAAFPGLLSGRSASELLDDADADLERLLGAGQALPVEEASALGAATFLTLDLVAGGPLTRPRETEYLRSSTGRMYAIEVMPPKDYGSLAVIEEPLRRLRAVLAEAREAHPDVPIGLTGKPVLQADEMAVSEADMTRASVVALSLIAVLFMAVFRGVRRPLLAVVAFAFAFGWTYGLATLLVGRLNLLSMVFMLVLVGVGLDYGVHVVARWQAARRRGAAREEACREVMRTAAVGNLTGAVTSAGVFLLALLTGFQGLRELGLIAGAGLLMCLVAMTLILPALLMLGDRRESHGGRADGHAPSHENGRSGGHPLPGTILLAATALLSVWFLVLVPGELRFASNLLELQAEGVESVEWERRLFADDTSASWFAVAPVDDIEALPALIEAARRQPEIGRTGSILDLVALPTPERTTPLETLASATAVPIHPRPLTAAEPLDPIRLEATAERLDLITRFGSNRLPEVTRNRLESIGARLRTLAAELTEDTPEGTRERTSVVDRGLDRAAIALHELGTGARIPLREALPAALRPRYMSPQGRFLLTMQPRENVWEEDEMAAFVSAVRRVDPRTTGVPITQFESMNDMRNAFLVMGLGSILVVLVATWLDFRSWLATTLCFGSLSLGILWTLGLLVLLDIPINLANFFAIPILIGLGIDSSIHVVHRWQEMRRSGDARLGVTLRAVTLTAVTTGIGFGALLTARHRGLQSLGWVMLLGSLSCLVVSVFVLPRVLVVLDRFRPVRERTRT